MTRAALVLAASMTLLSACVPAEPDAFDAKLAAGCNTQAECDALFAEADARGGRCVSDLNGPDCNVLLAQYNRAGILRAEQRERGTPVTYPAVDDDAGVPIDSGFVLAITPPLTKPSPDELAPAPHGMSAGERCFNEHDPRECTDAGLDPQEAASCYQKCRSRVASNEDAVVKGALVGCQSEFVNHDGHTAPRCLLSFRLPGANRAAWERGLAEGRRGDCTRECEKRGRAFLAHAYDHIKCVDGTRSPTCTCNRDSFGGCCSHHSGIADDDGCPEIRFDMRTPVPNTSWTQPPAP